MFRRVFPLRLPLALWVIGGSCSGVVLADTMQVSLQPADLGPFPPALGGFIDFAVALELVDSEGDGPDTQGIAVAGFNIYTDTGLTVPWVAAALTGESGIYGPARVDGYRYHPFGLPDPHEPLFIGGYGFGATDAFGGHSTADDRIAIGGALDMSWTADGQPNAPGLQALAMAGVGYGERPAGGDWLFAEGEIPIPTDPGVYTVELEPNVGYYILPGVDLTIDHSVGWRGAFGAGDIFGDSFSFTVLPEPGSIFFAAISAALLLRMRRSRNRS